MSQAEIAVHVYSSLSSSSRQRLHRGSRALHDPRLRLRFSEAGGRPAVTGCGRASLADLALERFSKFPEASPCLTRRWAGPASARALDQRAAGASWFRACWLQKPKGWLSKAAPQPKSVACNEMNSSK